jgi:hypothetical protein
MERHSLGNTMKPRKIQYVLAHGIKIATIGGGLALATVVALFSRGFSLWTVLATLAAVPLGAILGMFFLWPGIHIICRFLNGSPLRTGDTVHILIGPHRDRTGRVYDVWPSRGQVCVDLGEQNGKAVKDFFSINEVCRENDS